MMKTNNNEDGFNENIIKSIETLLDEEEISDVKSNNGKTTTINTLKPSPKMSDVPDHPMIQCYLYGGTQDYLRWSTIESDELKNTNQQYYVNPTEYDVNKKVANNSPQKILLPNKTSIQPHFGQGESPLHQYQSKTHPSLSPTLSRNPLDFILNEKNQMLLNHYLLYNYQLYANNYIASAGSFANNNPYINLENFNYGQGNFYNPFNLQDAKQNLKYQRMYNFQYQKLMQQQDYLKILNYYSSVKQQKSMVAPPKIFCAFCKKNGEPV